VTSRRAYLDHASTTPLRPAARDAMSRWIEEAGGAGGVGDPGRVHEEGRRARGVVESAREVVADFLGADPSRVIFTSGATEAANTAVSSSALRRPDAPLACAAVEHSSVREACRRSGQLVELPVEASGRLNVSGLDDLLRQRGKPALVNCQLANHEVGTLQPLGEVVTLCSQAGVPVHCDAAAAVGHIPVSFRQLGVDLMSVSAHKLGGPPGIGALVVRRGVRLSPLLVGGSEERARRAGAENVIGIVGFAAACEEIRGVLDREAATAAAQTQSLAAAATAVSGVEVVGDGAERLPHIVCLSVGGVLGEAVLLSLDRAGVAAHSGSACSSEVLEPSPVLAAMGADPDRSLRLSVGWTTSDEDLAAFAAAFAEAVGRLRALGGQT
jgi:cysteine desulfurase